MNKQKVDQGMSIIESIIIFIIFVLGGALLLTVFFAFKELNIQFLKEYTILIGEISISIFLLMKICSIKNYSIKLNYKINFKNHNTYLFYYLSTKTHKCFSIIIFIVYINFIKCNLNIVPLLSKSL